MRADYAFSLVRGGEGGYEVVRSDPVAITGMNQPLRPRASLAGMDGSSFQVMWTGKDMEDGAYLVVEREDGSSSNVPATASTYTAEDMVGKPANDKGWRSPGAIFKAVVAGVSPGERVTYTAVTSGGRLGPYPFHVPGSGEAASSTGAIIFGDMGVTLQGGGALVKHPEDAAPAAAPVQAAVSADLATGKFASVSLIGDLSYARGYASEWDLFLDQAWPVMATRPFFVVEGNHERDFEGEAGWSYFTGKDSGGEGGVPSYNLFPWPAPATLAKPYYSVNVGHAHHVYMSTEDDFTINSDQWQWIRSDLASVNRTATPWLIFLGHRPMYIDSDADSTPDSDQVVARLLRQNVEPLLLKYGVDIAFWGHHHTYQRSYPVPLSAGGHKIVHVVVGTGGHDFSVLGAVKPAEFDVVIGDQHGYIRLNMNSTVLEGSFVSTGGSKGPYPPPTVADSFVIKK